MENSARKAIKKIYRFKMVLARDLQILFLSLHATETKNEEAEFHITKRIWSRILV